MVSGDGRNALQSVPQRVVGGITAQNKGGVSVVSAYVIWIHHEEEENVFDFEGCRDIGTFVRLCRKVGLSVFLRIGPFVHGEVRNGGFPDWIIEREKEGMAIRCNNEEYLGYVRRFWKKVYAQVDGCMEKDGGPVIGIQIENEYGHVGGLQGPEGEAHIRTLTAMAKEIGFDVPLYTATGWGGACFRSWAATVKHHGIRERARLSRTQTLCSATQGTMH